MCTYLYTAEAELSPVLERVYTAADILVTAASEAFCPRQFHFHTALIFFVKWRFSIGCNDAVGSLPAVDFMVGTAGHCSQMKTWGSSL